MPKLSSPNIVEIILPSSEPDDPAIVKLDVNITTRQGLELSSSDSKTEAMVSLVAGCIKEWNFVDEQGNVAEISDASVGRLSLEDFTAIAEKLSESIDNTIGKKKVGEAEKKA